MCVGAGVGQPPVQGQSPCWASGQWNQVVLVRDTSKNSLVCRDLGGHSSETCRNWEVRRFFSEGTHCRNAGWGGEMCETCRGGLRLDQAHEGVWTPSSGNQEAIHGLQTRK